MSAFIKEAKEKKTICKITMKKIGTEAARVEVD